jgi:hypothetical protein
MSSCFGGGTDLFDACRLSEAGKGQKKNIVNALTKIPTDWAVSTVVTSGRLPIAYGITFSAKPPTSSDDWL